MLISHPASDKAPSLHLLFLSVGCLSSASSHMHRPYNSRTLHPFTAQPSMQRQSHMHVYTLRFARARRRHKERIPRLVLDATLHWTQAAHESIVAPNQRPEGALACVRARSLYLRGSIREAEGPCFLLICSFLNHLAGFCRTRASD